MTAILDVAYAKAYGDRCPLVNARICRLFRVLALPMAEPA
jgi:hypothetical protein